jgi:hypothetical protein
MAIKLLQILKRNKGRLLRIAEHAGGQFRPQPIGQALRQKDFERHPAGFDVRSDPDMYPKFECSLLLPPRIGTSENERVNGHHPTGVSKRGVQIALFTTELSEVGLPCSAERRFRPMTSKTLLPQGVRQYRINAQVIELQSAF